MRKTVSISFSKRSKYGTGEARRMRHDGKIPAVVYGQNTATEAIFLKEEEAKSIINHAGMLELVGDGENKSAILKAIQQHPVSRKILHIDFLKVALDEVISVDVPVEAFGEAAGIKHGGQLEQTIYELKIECLPMNVPELIKVDVSHVEMDKTLQVKDIILDKELKVLDDEELVVFQVRAPRVELTIEETDEETDEETTDEETTDEAEEKKEE